MKNDEKVVLAKKVRSDTKSSNAKKSQKVDKKAVKSKGLVDGRSKGNQKELAKTASRTKSQKAVVESGSKGHTTRSLRTNAPKAEGAYSGAGIGRGAKKSPKAKSVAKETNKVQANAKLTVKEINKGEAKAKLTANETKNIQAKAKPTANDINKARTKRKKRKNPRSRLKNMLIAAAIFVVLLGGSLGGYFLWQHNIFYTVDILSTECLGFQYDSLTVRKGEDFGFAFELKENFAQYEDLFAVVANGEKLTETDGKYVVKNVINDIEIEIFGVGSSGLQITDKTVKGYSGANKTLYIPNGVEIIAESACKSKSNITSLIISPTVKRIGIEAFYSCGALANITLGKGLEYIGKDAFLHTAWLFSQPEGTVYLDDWVYCFKNYSASKQCSIREGIVGIGSYAFIVLNQLETLLLPSTLKYIGDYAFAETNLKELNLPQGILSIGEVAFARTKMQELVLPGQLVEVGMGAFIQCGSLVSVVFESEVKFGDLAFCDCDKLERVLFEKGAKNISSDLFVECEKLTSITINSETVPELLDSTAFSGIPNFNIFVPSGSVDIYKASPGWSIVADHIVEMPQE